MPGTRIQEALGHVESGPLVTDVHFMASGNTIRGIREAVIPDGSLLDDPNITAIVASNGNANDHNIDAAIALERAEDGSAQMTIDPREQLITRNPKYLGRVLQAISKQFGYERITVDPETDTGSIDADTLVKAGFIKQTRNRAVFTNPDRVKGVPIGKVKVA